MPACVGDAQLDLRIAAAGRIQVAIGAVFLQHTLRTTVQALMFFHLAIVSGTDVKSVTACLCESMPGPPGNNTWVSFLAWMCNTDIGLEGLQFTVLSVPATGAMALIISRISPARR